MDLNELRKLVNEACGVADSHSGAKMARTDLVTIAKDAQELVNMFGDDSELPDWVESKLTKAADYLNSVKKYIGGEIVRQQGGLMEDKTQNSKQQIIEEIARAGLEAMMNANDFALEKLIPNTKQRAAFTNDVKSAIKKILMKYS